MNFKIFRILLIFIVFSFPSICIAEKPDSRVWEKLSENSYYNKTNITKSPNTTSVWIYKTVTNEERKEKIDIVKKEDMAKSMMYLHYDHYVGLWEFDCNKRLFRGKEFKDYDDKGRVLSSIKRLFDWNNIKPNSAMDILYSKVCSIPKKPLNKK